MYSEVVDVEGNSGSDGSKYISYIIYIIIYQTL